MIEGAFYGTAHFGLDDDAAEIGDAIDAVLGRDGAIEDHGDIEDGDLVGLGVVVAVDKEALIFIAEIVAEDPFHPGAFLFDDQLREVIIVHAGQVYVGVSIPGTGNGLGVRPGKRGEEKDNI